MAIDIGRLKAWAKNNGPKLAAAGGAVAVVIFALVRRGKTDTMSTVAVPQQLPIADGTYDGTAGGGSDAFGQISTFLSQFADAQQAQNDRITDTLANLYTSQQDNSSSVAALFAAQASAAQASSDALTKQLAAAVKTITTPKKEPAAPAAPKKAAEPAKKKAEPAPAKKATTPTKVTVKSGDSLSKIAAANGITTKQIIKLNPQIANPNLIYAGQKVVVKK